jgi:NAD dependent epimerase/dehydratase family enzyme
LWNLEENFIEDEAFWRRKYHPFSWSYKRWTNKYKKELYTSRIDTAKLLKKYALKHHLQLKSFISASGVNYGTFTSNEILTEDTPIKKLDFLAELCKNWEEAAFDFTDISERIVCLRTSPVLAKKGGTFEL